MFISKFTRENFLDKKKQKKRVRSTFYVHSSASCSSVFYCPAIFHYRLLLITSFCRNFNRIDVGSVFLDYQTLGRPRSFNSENYCCACTLVSISRTTFCYYTICHSWLIHSHYHYSYKEKEKNLSRENYTFQSIWCTNITL